MRKKHARVVIMVISLVLIGGTGCITATVVGTLQERASENRIREQRKSEIEADRVGAAKGERMAKTRLAFDYLRGYPYVVTPGSTPLLARDVGKGMAMLEELAAQNFGPAQFILGEVLIDDSVLQVDLTERIPADPQRGLELIKQASTRICVMPTLNDYSYLVSPAWAVSSKYRRGPMASADQADAWAARAILTCTSLTHVSFDDKVTNLAFQFLVNDQNTIAPLLASMSAGQIAQAKVKMKQLLAAAAELQRSYPAPTSEQAREP